MNLKQQLEAAVANARKSFEAGDMDKGREFRVEADRIAGLIKEMKSLNDLSGIEYETMRPELPGAGAGALPKETKSAVELPTKNENAWVEAAYVKRFSTVDATTKSILTELHGSDYQNKFLSQKRAFRKYLVGGENVLTSTDRQSLSGVVMTPDTVKAAIEQGVESGSEIKATMVEATDTLAGYFVPIDQQNRMIELVEGQTVIRPRASKLTTNRDRVEFPTAIDNGSDATQRYTSTARVRWVDESPSGLASINVNFGMVGIPVHTSMVETFLSRNLLEDTTSNIEDYLAKKLAEAAAIDEDDQFLLGNGIGRPEGILPGGLNSHGIPEVNLGNVSPFIGWEPLIDLTYASARQYRSQSGFLARKTTYQAVRKLKDVTGQYVWQPFAYAGGAGDEPGQLLGYRFEEAEGMPGLASGAYPILFGDIGAYQIVDRVGMTIERFGQQDSALARQNLVSFIMRRRLGGKLLEPWRLVAGKSV